MDYILKIFFSFECIIFFFANSIFFSYIWISLSWNFSRLVLHRITAESFLFFFFHWLFVELATRKKRQHVMPVFRIGIQSAVITKILVKLYWAETKRGIRKIHSQNKMSNMSTLKRKDRHNNWAFNILLSSVSGWVVERGTKQINTRKRNVSETKQRVRMREGVK